jgi:hypothetical protein
MIGAMYEVQLAEDRQRVLFDGARDYRLAKLARRGPRRGRRSHRSADQVA